MRSILTLALVSIVALGSMFIMGCGGEGREDQPQTETEEPATGSTEADEPIEEPSSAEFTWDDMPVYTNATPADESEWMSIEMEGGTYEYRYYESDDSVDDVADFYTSELPNNGWGDTSFLKYEGTATASFSKSDGKDNMSIVIEESEGITFISLIRVITE